MDSNHRSLSRAIRSILRKVNCGRIDRAAPKFCGVPMVRIHLLPADSPSLSRSHFRASRTRAFPAGVRGSLDDGVSRDAVGFPLRANRRQCLCRAIFQYRIAADAVSGNATNEIRSFRALAWVVFEIRIWIKQSRARSADRARQAADVSARGASLPSNRAAAAHRGSPR